VWRGGGRETVFTSGVDDGRMSPWQCAVRGCGAQFPDAEAALVHQATAHDPHTCKVCGAETPEGYFAIRHALDEHGRAEYVRAYDADAAAIRERESVKADVESAVDVDRVLARLDAEGQADGGTGAEPETENGD
jgi:hypothetical protein